MGLSDTLVISGSAEVGGDVREDRLWDADAEEGEMLVCLFSVGEHKFLIGPVRSDLKTLRMSRA